MEPTESETKTFAMKVKLTTSQQEFEVQITPSLTLEDLKALCCNALNESIEMKLIYRGKILKESDDLSILKPGQSLYLVRQQKSAVETPAPVPISSGAGNMAGLLHGLNHFGVMNQATSMLNEIDSLQSENELESSVDPQQMAMISQMMANPATRDFMLNSMQQLMSNPQMREMLVNSNPSLRRLVQSNPGVLDAMSNPMVMEQMKSMMERMAVGNTMGPLSGDVNSFPLPGGGNNPPVNNSANNSANLPNNPSNYNRQGFNPLMQNQLLMNQFSNLFANPANSPNPTPPPNPSPPQGPIGNPPQNVPNPQIPFSNPFMNPLMNMFMNPNPNASNPPANIPFNPFFNAFNNPLPNNAQYPLNNTFNAPIPNPINPNNPANLRQMYSTQLQSMKDMGFVNEEANIKALQASNGDVNIAIERLLNMLG